MKKVLTTKKLMEDVVVEVVVGVALFQRVSYLI